MKVKLIEKFNMSIGTVLVIKAPSVLQIGDLITDGEKEYKIKEFIHPSGAYDESMISVRV